MLYMLHYILHLLLHLSMHFIPRFPPTSPLVPLVPSPPLPQLSSLRGWATMKSLCAKRSGALHRADTQPTHPSTHKHTHTHTHTHTCIEIDRHLSTHTLQTLTPRGLQRELIHRATALYGPTMKLMRLTTHTSFLIGGGVGPCLLCDALCVRSNITARLLFLWHVAAFRLTFFRDYRNRDCVELWRCDWSHPAIKCGSSALQGEAVAVWEVFKLLYIFEFHIHLPSVSVSSIESVELKQIWGSLSPE